MRLINGDALKIALDTFATIVGFSGVYDRGQVMECIDAAPTVATDTNVLGKWISVKNDLPTEHDSIFAHMPLVKGMWATESDNVIVYVRFPDGTGQATEGRLQDGKWRTRISRTLEPVVTHWMPMPGEPKEVSGDER